MKALPLPMGLTSSMSELIEALVVCGPPRATRTW